MKLFTLGPPTSSMAVTKGSALLFCSDLSEIRLERDEGEGNMEGGRKETDRGGRNRGIVKKCDEDER